MQAAVIHQDPAPSRYPVHFHGTGGGFFFVFAKNLLLTVVTLGIYLPWARTERRKYLWQNLEFAGQRFRYHGTGLELFYGYLKVLGAYAVFLGVPLLIAQFDKTLSVVVQIGLVVVLIPLIPIAIYGSQRYLLSRTSLRGVRFGLDPGAGGYLKLFLLGYLFTVLTLGLYAPVWQNELYGYLTRKKGFGSEPFGYDGKNGDAFKIAIKGFLLTLVTLGLYFPWYMARMARFRTEHTTFQNARARLEMTGGDIFVLWLVSLFGTMVTLGLAFPWITAYVMRTIAEKTSFVGTIDFSRIEQRIVRGDAAADGLADALDVGLQI